MENEPELYTGIVIVYPDRCPCGTLFSHAITKSYEHYIYVCQCGRKHVAQVGGFTLEIDVTTCEPPQLNVDLSWLDNFGKGKHGPTD